MPMQSESQSEDSVEYVIEWRGVESSGWNDSQVHRYLSRMRAEMAMAGLRSISTCAANFRYRIQEHITKEPT